MDNNGSQQRLKVVIGRGMRRRDGSVGSAASPDIMGELVRKLKRRLVMKSPTDLSVFIALL